MECSSTRNIARSTKIKARPIESIPHSLGNLQLMTWQRADSCSPTSSFASIPVRHGSHMHIVVVRERSAASKQLRCLCTKLPMHETKTGIQVNLHASSMVRCMRDIRSWRDLRERIATCDPHGHPWRRRANDTSACDNTGRPTCFLCNRAASRAITRFAYLSRSPVSPFPCSPTE